MPFGLSTVPQTYECFMAFTLSGLQLSLCLIYLDDVIVFSHDFGEQIARLDEVLIQIGGAGLKLTAWQICCLCTQGILSGAHKFIKDFSQKVQSLIEHTKKNKPFRWT